MSSVSKKRKQVSMYCDGSSLKWKDGRCKRVMFFNSAQRQEIKNEMKKAIPNSQIVELLC